MAFDGEAERCCSSRAHRAGDLPHPWPEGHDRCRSRRTVRFPTDFMFQLTRAEAASLRSQIVILERGRGKHRKYLPYALTQKGVPCNQPFTEVPVRFSSTSQSCY